MKSALLLNLGTRDLQFKGAFLGQTGKSIWDESEELMLLLKNGRVETADFQMPLISQLLTKLLSLHQAVDQVYLFFTDQSDPTYQAKDTLHMAEIIKRVLPVQLGRQCGEITLLRITDPPNNYDLMNRAYDRLLHQVWQNLPLYYASITGGTPAENMALLLNLIKIFREKAQILYVDERGGVEIQEIGKVLLETFYLEQIKAHLLHFDYGIAAAIAEKTALKQLNSAHVALLKSTNLRLLFDFKGALELLQRIEKGFKGTDRIFLEDVLNQLQPLVEGDFKAQISELYYNLRVKWEKEEYVDVLARLYRLSEVLLQYIFEQATQHTFDWIDLAKRKQLYNFLDSSAATDLRKFLVKCRADLTAVNRELLSKALYFFVKEKIYPTDLRALMKPIDTLIKTLRHKTIIAHGFTNATRALIEATYQQEVKDPERNFFQDLERIFELIGLPLGANPFFQLNEYILQVFP